MSSWNNAAKVSPAPAFTSSANLGEVEWIPRLPESISNLATVAPTPITTSFLKVVGQRAEAEPQRGRDSGSR